jgi:hypothetical protein
MIILLKSVNLRVDTNNCEGMMVIKRIGTVLLLVVSMAIFSACSQSGDGSMIGDDDPQQTQLPKIKVNLPPPPSFQKDNAPETYPDSSYSVYGLRKNIKTKINTQVRLKGFLLELYECPECPKGATCPDCRKPHFWLSDRANGPKEKALLVTDYPQEDPLTKKKMVFEAGAQYYVTGTYSKTSGTGFSASDGLVVYAESKIVGAE